MPLPQKIRELRTKQNLTQELLAERMGVSRQAVTKWENGQSSPSMKKLLMLAELFGVPMSELVQEDFPAKPGRRWLFPALAGLSAVLLAVSGWNILRLLSQPPRDIIGYADAPTELYVVSDAGSFWPLYLVTAAVVAATVFLGVRKGRKGEKRG